MSHQTSDHLRLLVVQPEAAHGEATVRALGRRGHGAKTVANIEAAAVALKGRAYDAVAVVSQGDGQDRLAAIQALDPHVAVVVISARPSLDEALACNRAGAADYLPSADDPAVVAAALERAGASANHTGLMAMQRAVEALLAATGPDDLSQAVLGPGVTAFGAASGALVVGDPFGIDAAFFCPPSLGEDLAAQLAQYAFQAEGPLRMVAGLAGEEDVLPALVGSGFHSTLVFPLRSEGSYLGTLLFLRDATQLTFGRRDLTAATLYAAAVTLCLEKVRLGAKYQAAAIVDESTGLFSRRFVYETLWQHMKRLTRTQPPFLCCLLVGLDDPQGLRDRLGRAEFERALKKVAGTILLTVRGSDVVGRYGRGEIVILLPQTDDAGGQLVAEKIRTAMAAAAGVPSVAIGLASYDFAKRRHVRSMKEASDLSMELINRAHAAMSRARAAGKGMFMTWEG